jgi:fibronectin type 3 domain-containing protein
MVTLQVGQVSDVAGNTPATSVLGTFNVNVPVQLFAAHFDFGPTGSPVAAGYTGVGTAAFSSSLGYGFLPGADLWALDRGALSGTNALTEDFVQTDAGGATFAVNVPNGTYNVTPTLGDALYGHDLQGIYLQGTKVDSITTQADQFISKTYSVNVTNGQLQFTLKDLGGVDQYDALDGLDIAQTAATTPATGAPVLAAATDSGVSSSDGLTNFDNSTPARALQFTVPGTVAGAVVTLFADGTAIGSATASGTSTTIATSGNQALANGTHIITAKQTSPGSTPSIPSPSTTITIDTTAPSTPASLAVTALTQASISLSWAASTDNVGVTGYTVYRGTTAAGTVSGSTLTFTDSGLTPGTLYSYTVVASDGAGNKSAASTAVNGTTTIPQFADASFEAVNAGTTYAYDPASPNWTFANNAGVEVNGSAWGAANAPDGKQAAFLQSNTGVGGSIKQSVSFTAAGKFQLSFYGAQRTGHGVAPIVVTVDGVTVATITPVSTSFQIYTTPAFNLTAGPHTFTLATAVITTADTDSFIDNVKLAVAPTSLFSAHFDFGPTGSPVAAGYTAVGMAAYNSTLGYGWLAGANLWALDRGALAGSSTLTEDFIQTDSGGATFSINVPNGVYNVTPTLGDALYAHDLQGIYLQGTQVDTITTAKDQFISKTYTITVTNGQILFTFKDLGGVDLYAALDALDIVQVS